MVKRPFAALLTIVLAVLFSSMAFAQEMKQEMKKDETKKEAMHKEMGEMKVGSCSPECGFMVRSHNESEVMEMLKTHAKKQHNMNMSDKDAMAKIKPAGHMERGEMKKEETKEMKKESK